MRITALAAMTALSLGAQTITVYVRDDARLAAAELCQAKSKAARIFASAQVRVIWVNGEPKTWILDEQRPIVVRILSGMATPEHSAALAFAQAYEGVHITILYERVRAFAPDRPEMTLAYVLVHEITHMLEGVSRHSETGIMKANWSMADRYAMRKGQLFFSSEDLDLIHLSLASRAARSAAGNKKIGRIPLPGSARDA